ncbi:hypothetical protein, partial [Burkholderia cenocepacia]|uniref:hypothetical protein n=1 Tax=Burkholderia cenocepacia TaxID=95486 RepID=UPI00076C7B66
MKLPLIILSCVVMLMLSDEARAQANDGTDPDAPIVAKFHHIRPYEITEGTPIVVGLETGDPGIGGMMIGIVSLNVYDRFGNVAIPKGSKLIGQTIRQVNDRREVQWSGLQLRGTATLQFDPPLEGCMPDGSAGITVSALRQPDSRVCLHSMKCVYILFFARSRQDGPNITERRGMGTNRV